MVPHLQSALGIVVIIAIAWALSEDRKAFNTRMVAGTLVLQAAIALLLLKAPVARDLLRRPNRRGIEYIPWWWGPFMLLVRLLPAPQAAKL